MYFKRIKYTREDSDLTQNQISEMLKVKRGIYTAMENGQVTFPLHIIEQLADFYNVSIDYLVELTNVKRYTINPQKADYRNLGKKIRKIRRKLRLSQESFAMDIGLKQSSYSPYENGKLIIKLDNLYILAKKYGFSIDGILGKSPSDDILEI